jgi:hypothetical protein
MFLRSVVLEQIGRRPRDVQIISQTQWRKIFSLHRPQVLSWRRPELVLYLREHVLDPLVHIFDLILRDLLDVLKAVNRPLSSSTISARLRASSRRMAGFRRNLVKITSHY